MLFEVELLNEIKDILVKRKETVSVAESVTSGFLQVAFSSADSASLFFQGGITTYNLGQKARHLLINPIYASECDCVSDRIAVEMALSSNKLFSSDYAIGITGYATTIPEKGVHKLFAHYAIAYKKDILANKKIESDKSEGYLTQLFYAEAALNELYHILTQLGYENVD